MNELISVVIPVYNVEKYAERCFYSVAAQTYDNFEVILIDDGSTDGSGKLCDEFKEKDPRFRVIHKKNGGLSSARNAGIRVAKGEYIAFVDSDDIVSEEFLSRLYFAAKAAGVDMSMCGNKVFFSEDEIGEMHAPFPIKIITYNEYLRDIFKYHEIYIPAWDKLYKRSIFEEISFPEGKIHEDTFTSPLCAEKAGKIACIDDVLYYYFYNTEGIAHAKFSPRRFDDVEAHVILLDKAKEAGFTQTAKSASEWLIYSFIKVLSRKKDSFTDYKAVKKELKKVYKQVRKKLLKVGVLRADWKVVVFLSKINIRILKAYRRFLNFAYKLSKKKD